MLSNDGGAGDACAGDVSVPCRVCPRVDIFHIDLNEHKRLLAFPRPVGGIEAAALRARTPVVGAWRLRVCRMVWGER
jgi:hypothetical protein